MVQRHSGRAGRSKTRALSLRSSPHPPFYFQHLVKCPGASENEVRRQCCRPVIAVKCGSGPPRAVDGNNPKDNTSYSVRLNTSEHPGESASTNATKWFTPPRRDRLRLLENCFRCEKLVFVCLFIYLTFYLAR